MAFATASGDSVEVEYVEGCSLTDYVDEKARLLARRHRGGGSSRRVGPILVVLAIGGNELTAKEGEDSDDISLPWAPARARPRRPRHRQTHRGRPPPQPPLAFPWVAENIPAILDGWFLGQETGTAVAEALFGDINPGGKLPFSIPRNVGQIPAYYYWTFGADRGYRDRPATPLFPFGHGLSYTSFEYGELKLQPHQPRSGQDPAHRVRRLSPGRWRARPGLLRSDHRRGERTPERPAGDEVVQLYIRDQFASVVRPRMELKRFERISLEPGESRQVTFELGHDALAFYDIEIQELAGGTRRFRDHGRKLF